jgi:hypothetical protein
VAALWSAGKHLILEVRTFWPWDRAIGCFADDTGVQSDEVHELTTRATDFLVNMSASADVLAQAKVEIDLAAIPEGKNVRRPTTAVSEQQRLTPHRSLSSGAASPSSSDTAPRTRSKRPKTPSGKPCATRSPTRSACRSPSGWSWWVSAPTWDVCPLARPATLEAGSAPATVLTTTFLAA